MEKLITYDEALRIDLLTQEKYKIPSITLMERAGLEAAIIFHDIINSLDKSRSYKNAEDLQVLVLCGGGNNGGDGIVFARTIQDLGYRVKIAFTNKLKTQEILQQLDIVKELSFTFIDDQQLSNEITTLTKQDWIIDAISGVGLKKTFRNKELIHLINKSKARIFSIDVPTGLLEYQNINKDFNLVKADYTVTMGLAKASMYIAEQRIYSGTIKIANLVFPQTSIQQAVPEAFIINYTDIKSIIKPLVSSVYKHSRGVLIIASGSEASPGAAILSSEAATKGPAGMVFGVFDKAIANIVVQQVPSIVSGKSLESINIANAIVIGPGWGLRAKSDFEKFQSKNLPMIIDAEALRLVASENIVFLKPHIMTPHLGELKNLARSIPKYKNDPDLFLSTHWWEYAKDIADYYRSVVIAKNSVTFITCPNSIPVIIDGSNPLLATAGSGDVLAGILGSILAYNEAQLKNNALVNNINNINQDIEHQLKNQNHSLYQNMCVESPMLKEIFNKVDDMYKELLLVAIIGTIIHSQAGKLLSQTQSAGNASDIVGQITKIYSLV